MKMIVVWISYAILLFSLLLRINNAQLLDPVKNLCIRFDHQAVIKNQTLYIDGGRQTFVDQQEATTQKDNISSVTITGGYNTYLITVDLSSSWSTANVPQTAIAKVEKTGTGLPVPLLSRAALYGGRSDDSNIYLSGGTTSPWNESFPGYVPPLPPQYSLWSFNIATRKWNQFDTGQTVQNRPNGGPSAEAADQGLAFFLNGMIDDHSQTGNGFYLANDSKPFLQGMIVVDTVKKTERNISTAAATGDYPISRGKMEYIPSIGSKGILVTIGGNRKYVGDYSNQYVGDLVAMDQISVFDVASLYNASTPNGIWYKQRATGDIPERRLDHCLMVASAQDNSSHNIYMIGGRSSNGTANIFFDDVYILSLPSFVWTKVYQGKSPLYAHQCGRANSRMMIRSGGAQSFDYFSLPCDKASGLGVLDISDIRWVDNYDSSPDAYLLPTQVVNKIGGTRAGGAVKLEPANGFDQDGLARLFREKQRLPIRDGQRRLPTTPFIIGGVLGSIAIVGVGGAIFFVYRRRIQNLIKTGQWRAEMDGDGRSVGAEMEATEARPELPEPTIADTAVKYVQPCDKPVELSVRDSDLPWRELQPRDCDLPWGGLDGKGRINGEPPPLWEPPVTKHGVPF